MKTTPRPNLIHIQPFRWLFPLTLLVLASFVPPVDAAPKSTAVPLVVAIGNQAGDALQSDEGGPYGGAQFTSDGFFNFSSGNPGTSGRVVNIFNVAGLPPANTLDPVNFSPSEYQIQIWSTGPSCFDGPHRDLRTLNPGEQVSVGLVIRILVPSLLQPNSRQQTEWFVRFGDFPNDPNCGTLHNKWPCDGGAFATITRLNSATWVLSAPATDVCLIEAVRASKGNVIMTHRGYISFPFSMTLTSQ